MRYSVDFFLLSNQTRNPLTGATSAIFCSSRGRKWNHTHQNITAIGSIVLTRTLRSSDGCESTTRESLKMQWLAKRRWCPHVGLVNKGRYLRTSPPHFWTARFGSRPFYATCIVFDLCYNTSVSKMIIQANSFFFFFSPNPRGQIFAL